MLHNLKDFDFITKKTVKCRKLVNKPTYLGHITIYIETIVFD